ncbi:cell wall-active antibiotics response protein LiaF [Brochothrix campestris]|uniref:YvqF protein n=1 Tax=Brochothrix campestris FSL F6-1037 TaxID=1265861 RepID=W7CM77_9LIST|nr:cell wall-active antibiotics response protein LiaF [Brochothrix campestris]EUJ40654.1 YvqF protein [Brochothrix campestris FSL F6-1037]
MKSKQHLYSRLLIVLLITTVVELMFHRELLILLIVGLMLMFIMYKRNKQKRPNQHSVLFWLGVVCIVLAIAGTVSFRLGLLIGLILFVKHLFDIKHTADLINVQLQEPNRTRETKRLAKNKLIGDYHYGDTPFEWDNINIQFGIGNVIIDLGNTVLPPGENIAMIRGLVGDMRIVVPIDVGIALDYSAFSGQLNYQESETATVLRQENLVHYSDNYEEATYKIKLVVSVIIGELEVMHV